MGSWEEAVSSISLYNLDLASVAVSVGIIYLFVHLGFYYL
jgi:hypothetical protein